ncbi:MAG: hypothetical protein M3R04_07515 [bacterium]|nr:hypothetical protein [bacterium]
MTKPVLVIGVALLFIGCTPGGYGPHNSHEPPVTIYLPFVEEVTFPGTVVENHFFEIHLRISADLKPELLNGLTSDHHHLVIGDDWPTLQLWVKEPTGGGFNDRLVFSTVANEPGTHTMRIQSAASREFGGISTKFRLDEPRGSPPIHFPNSTFQEYTITVLPDPGYN